MTFFIRKDDTMYRIGIVGYGNLAKGAECAIAKSPDMKLGAVFTRRDPSTVQIHSKDVPVLPLSELPSMKGELDLLLLCAGSATDLPVMTPELAGDFSVIDSFDTHAGIPEHFARVDRSAKEGGNIALISGGWDPGLFSLNRLYAQAILPEGREYTFWGTGVSQGHSDAVRRIPGVLDCRQYTIPVPEAMDAVRRGEQPELEAAQKHRRHCYVVAKEGADRQAIVHSIVNMPNYFAPYETTVEFITQEELLREHKGLPHGGHVIRSGRTGWEGENKQSIEFSLDLDSNPEFTASVLVACARALLRMKERGQIGCYTMFDLTPADMSPLSREELLAHYL